MLLGAPGLTTRCKDATRDTASRREASPRGGVCVFVPLEVTGIHLDCTGCAFRFLAGECGVIVGPHSTKLPQSRDTESDQLGVPASLKPVPYLVANIFLDVFSFFFWIFLFFVFRGRCSTLWTLQSTFRGRCRTLWALECRVCGRRRTFCGP